MIENAISDWSEIYEMKYIQYISEACFFQNILIVWKAKYCYTALFTGTNNLRSSRNCNFIKERFLHKRDGGWHRGWHRGFNTGVFLWICGICKNIYFEEHLGTATSVISFLIFELTFITSSWLVSLVSRCVYNTDVITNISLSSACLREIDKI